MPTIIRQCLHWGGDSSHHPWRLLTSGSEVGSKRSSPPGKNARQEKVREEQTDDDSYLVLAALYNVNNWRKKTDNIGCFIANYTQTQLSEEDDYFRKECETSYSYHKLFQPDNFVLEIAQQSKLYAAQRLLKRVWKLGLWQLSMYRSCAALLWLSYSYTTKNEMWELKP